jgi:two-component system OmpR family sensor kinase
MSLRARLILGIGAVILALVAALVIVSTIERDFVVAQLDAQLRGIPFELADLPPPEGLPGPPEPPVSNLYIGRIDPDGALHAVVRGRLLEDEPVVSGADLSRGGGESQLLSVPGRRGHDRFRLFAVHRAGGAWNIAALPLTETEEAVSRLRLALGIAAVAIVAVLLLTGWWMIRLGLRPIARITATADAITTGDHDQRVALGDPRTEAGRLARAFNVMLDERDAADARLRQFLADAAHELRTPLTSIRGYLDLQAQGGLRSPEGREEAVRRMRAESRRMAELVEDLLLLANLDQAVPLARDPVDLADVLRDAGADALAVQPGRPVSVDVPDGTDELTIVGDERHLREVVAELVHNALVHTPADAALLLRGVRAGTTIGVTIADTGPGLAPGDATRIFDRFYRGDPSRARPSGGSGLGLSITRAIIEAHQGTISVASTPGCGCTFQIHLPPTCPAPGPE